MRTGGDAGPYNAREDTFSLFRTYREKYGLISIIVRARQSSGLSLFQFFHNITHTIITQIGRENNLSAETLFLQILR